MYVILIDSGTTNSRVRLVDNNSNVICDVEKIKVGVRNTAIDGDNSRLKESLYNAISLLLNRNNLSAKEINYIVASGMITSNLGIFEIPHVDSPLTIEKLAELSQVVVLEEMHNIPCVFIPGMSNTVQGNRNNLDSINDFDVMRGEEVESFGLIKQLDLEGKGILILPGSHTKFVIVDQNKTLSYCLSTLAGEVLMAIQNETILSESIDSQLINSIDKRYLLEGYNAAKTYGLTRSFYHVRLLQKFTELSQNKRANYYVGSVIYSDIQSLLSTLSNIKDIDWVAIGGSNPLKHAFTYLLSESNYDWNVIEATNEQVEYSVVTGALEVVKKMKQNSISI